MLPVVVAGGLLALDALVPDALVPDALVSDALASDALAVLGLALDAPESTDDVVGVVADAAAGVPAGPTPCGDGVPLTSSGLCAGSDVHAVSTVRLIAILRACIMLTARARLVPPATGERWPRGPGAFSQQGVGWNCTGGAFW